MSPVAPLPPPLGYNALRMMGRCRNGFEADAGALFHAVPRRKYTALCKAQPGHSSAAGTMTSEFTIASSPQPHQHGRFCYEDVEPGAPPELFCGEIAGDIHVQVAGRAACGEGPRVPPLGMLWPEGIAWVRLGDPLANCTNCLVATAELGGGG